MTNFDDLYAEMVRQRNKHEVTSLRLAELTENMKKRKETGSGFRIRAWNGINGYDSVHLADFDFQILTEEEMDEVVSIVSSANENILFELENMRKFFENVDNILND